MIDKILLQTTRHFPFQRFVSPLVKWISPQIFEVECIFQNSDGIYFDLDLSDHQPKQIFIFDYYEKNCVRWVRKFLQKGMTCIDAGANLGQYSFVAADCVGKKGRVFAFEPQPENRKRFERNLELNPHLAHQICLESLGLNNCSEQVKLYSSKESHTGMPSLFRRFSKSEEEHSVQVTSLDLYAQQNNIDHIDFMKIDIEGGEMKALQGAKNLLSQKRQMMILCEINAETLGWARTSPEELVEFLSSLGFSPYWPSAFPMPLRKFLVAPINVMDNIVFLKKG